MNTVLLLAVLPILASSYMMPKVPSMLNRNADVMRVSMVPLSVSQEFGVPADPMVPNIYPNMPDSIHPGVVTGKALRDLLDHAKQNGYAIPAVNCVSNSGTTMHITLQCKSTSFHYSPYHYYCNKQVSTLV